MPTFVAFGCVHHPVADEKARQWRLKRIREIQPDYVINLGDWFDADAASRWPNEHDWTLEQEFIAGAQDAEDINDAAPKAKKVWLEGNHDANIKAPNRINKKLRDLCDPQKYARFAKAIEGWRVIPYGHREKWHLGPVTFQHGAEANVNADRNQSLLYGLPNGLWIGAHTHRPVQVTQVLLPGKIPLPYWFCNAGCGADWDRMEYVSRSNIATWGHGLVIGECSSNGEGRRVYATKQWEAHVEVLRMAH